MSKEEIEKITGLSAMLKAGSEEISRGIDKLAKLTHGGTALLMASIAEKSVHGLLLVSMKRGLSKKKQERLFQGYGPLSSFAAKIDVAFAFDLLSEKQFADLNTIRAIRNRFAHSHQRIDFDDPEIIGLCKKLSGHSEQNANLQVMYKDAALALVMELIEKAKVALNKRKTENPPVVGGPLRA
jgi:hypothetical protein